ncbi:MAG: hypothetical protein AB7U73_02100 [Pirellulales bacterium]
MDYKNGARGVRFLLSPNRTMSRTDMSLDHKAIIELIKQLIASDISVGECMQRIIETCARDFPHPDWDKYTEIEYDEDVAALGSWIAGVFERQPAPFPIHGLWMGLVQRVNQQGHVWADMYVAATSHYDPSDPEYAWLRKNPRHFPDNAYAWSMSLCNIYAESYKSKTGLGIHAEWPLALAFGAFAVRSLLADHTTQLVGSSAPRIGVVVGFDDGDLLKIGGLTASGFEPARSTDQLP